jgi:polyferredoxin
MHSELIIVPVMFAAIFGVFYLYLSTRNKERLALIEKGADASIFMRGRSQKAAPIWKVLILNLALLLMGIGLGTLIAMILENTLVNVDEEPIYVGTIFLTAGLGLFVGFNLTKKLDQN